MTPHETLVLDFLASIMRMRAGAVKQFHLLTHNGIAKIYCNGADITQEVIGSIEKQIKDFDALIDSIDKDRHRA